MKAYGYPENEEDLASAVQLTEVTFVADPVQLRKIAAFLEHCAAWEEEHEGAGHLHFRDVYKEFWRELPPGATDVIVSK